MSPSAEISALYRLAGQTICIVPQLPALQPFLAKDQIIPTRDKSTKLEKMAIKHPSIKADGWLGDQVSTVLLWWDKKGILLEIPKAGRFWIANAGDTIIRVSSPFITDNTFMGEALQGPPLVLALALGGRWCLHASAASFQNKGIVFLGESGNGKSTIAAYLDEAGKPGWQRIADDILPVSLGEGGLTGWTHFPQLKLPAENQPSVHLPETILFDHIYLLDPDDSAISPKLKQLSTDETVRVLLGNTAGSRLFTPELLAGHLAFCAQAARHVPGYRLSYAHQRELLPVVKELLEQSLKQDKLQDIRKQL